MRRISDPARFTGRLVGSIGICLLVTAGPVFSRGAGDDKNAGASSQGKLVVGTQVVPIDDRVLIRRATVRVLAILHPDMIEAIPPAPADFSRLQTRRLDISAAEEFLFRIKQVSKTRIEIISQDKSTSGWRKKDQVVPLDEAETHFSRAIEKNAKDSGALVLRRSRANGQEALGKTRLADLDAAIRLDPKYAEAYRIRSDLEFTFGEFGLAMADFDRI